MALLDDHALVLKGLIAHLEKIPSIVVVGSHGSSQPFRAMLAAMPVDVALIDYSLALGDIDGVALIRALRASYPAMKVIVVSAHGSILVIRSLLQAGAHGFVAKSQDPDEVIRAMDAVLTGGEYLPPGMLTRLAASAMPALSPREFEVVRCILQGLSVTQIGAKYSRSLKTVSTQKTAAYRKLGIRVDNELHMLRPLLMTPDSEVPPT
ncbi:MAG: response regulator transcription factor [Luteibacter sp.]